jgi:hypothetical protein
LHRLIKLSLALERLGLGEVANEANLAIRTVVAEIRIHYDAQNALDLKNIRRHFLLHKVKRMEWIPTPHRATVRGADHFSMRSVAMMQSTDLWERNDLACDRSVYGPLLRALGEKNGRLVPTFLRE